MEKLRYRGGVSVKTETYRKLEKRAKREGKSVSLLTDELVNAALDAAMGGGR